jgi:inward rectifier potassium channel
MSPEELAAREVELQILVTGLDETSSQTIYAQARYDHSQIVWGARHADLLSEQPNGSLLLDLTRFNDVVPTQPTPEFPYPRTENA